jgi:hypothetical protein
MAGHPKQNIPAVKSTKDLWLADRRDAAMAMVPVEMHLTPAERGAADGLPAPRNAA